MKELIRELATIDDLRRQAGKRHDLGVVLFLCILAILQGADGYRSIGRFIRENKEFPALRDLQLTSLSFLKKRTITPINRDCKPSTSTVSRVLQIINPLALNQVLTSWQTKRLPVQETYFVCGDGKAIRGTLEDSEGKNQNFVSVCSFFEAFSNVVVAAVPYENAYSPGLSGANKVK